MKTVISKLRTALQICSLVTIFSTAAFGIFTSSAQAQCKTVFGREVCLEDLDITRKIRGSKEISERLWGEAGANAYQSAASIMRSRHGGSVGLDEIQKQYLRPHYGSLVDQVVVVYNARMMDEWTTPNGYDIKLNDVDSAAQTYCNRIYVKDLYQSGNRDQLLLLAHELRHAQQCQELGGEGNFGFHYFREYKRAGLSYKNNKLEQSAEERANSIASSVPNELITVPTITPLSIKRVFIKSAHGNYFLDHNIAAKAVALADQPYNPATGAYNGELWEIVDIGGGKVLIKSAHGNYFLDHNIAAKAISLADQPYNPATGAYDGELWEIVAR
jgi:hypothetical protein